MRDQELDEELKRRIIQAIVESYPAAFWRELYDRIAIMYLSMYEQIKHDTTVLDSHKLLKLQQDRPFKIDWVMSDVAQRFNIPCTTEAVSDGVWNHAYAVSGSVGLTQSYVQYYGEFPQAARFRQELSKASKFPKLEFAGEKAFNKAYEFYGLVAHSPIARKFDENSCKLASAQLCIPHPGMNEWAATIGLLELESKYAEHKAINNVESRKSPTLRKRAVKGSDDD